MSDGKLLALAALVVAALVFTFLPAIIAVARRHPDRAQIAALSPATLLSFLLWLALMTWAIGGKRDDGVIGKYIGRLQQRNLILPIVGGLVVLGLAGGAVALLR